MSDVDCLSGELYNAYPVEELKYLLSKDNMSRKCGKAFKKDNKEYNPELINTFSKLYDFNEFDLLRNNTNKIPAVKSNKNKLPLVYKGSNDLFYYEPLKISEFYKYEKPELKLKRKKKKQLRKASLENRLLGINKNNKITTNSDYLWIFGIIVVIVIIIAILFIVYK